MQGNKKCAREQQMFKVTKSLQGNKKCAREQKMKANEDPMHGGKVLSSVVHYSIELPCVVLYDLVWSYVAL